LTAIPAEPKSQKRTSQDGKKIKKNGTRLWRNSMDGKKMHRDKKEHHRSQEEATLPEKKKGQKLTKNNI
jgi:hypothetical protein